MSTFMVETGQLCRQRGAHRRIERTHPKMRVGVHRLGRLGRLEQIQRVGRTVCAVACVLLLACLSPCALGQDAAPSEAAGDGELPRLSWNDETLCMHDRSGDTVRVQCDEVEKRCLVAPDRTQSGASLERTRDCRFAGELYDELLLKGYTMVDAIAESPPGWHRDERNRVFQVTFDLLRRVWFDAMWAPRLQPQSDVPTDDADTALERGSFGTGFVASFRGSESSRHTFNVLAGRVAIPDLQTRAVLLDYELTHRSTRPLFHITEFFGEPERYDVHLDIGWGAHLLRVENERRQTDPRASGKDRDHTQLDFIGARLHWDVYQSDDLIDTVRIGTGISLGSLWSDVTLDEGKLYVRPHARAATQFVVDQSGLHNLTGEVRWDGFAFTGDVSDEYRQRVSARAGYEWIMIAINDQPLAWVVESEIAWRDEALEADQLWDFVARTGVRFSLWAPAREAQ